MPHRGRVVGAVVETPARIVGVDPGSAAAVGFAGLGAVQLARGNVLGTGLEHLWQSYGAARTLGDFRLAAAMALLAAVQMWRGRVLSPAASLFLYAAMMRGMDGRRQ
jgi:hypothetical protein